MTKYDTSITTSLFYCFKLTSILEHIIATNMYVMYVALAAEHSLVMYK